MEKALILYNQKFKWPFRNDYVNSNHIISNTEQVKIVLDQYNIFAKTFKEEFNKFLQIYNCIITDIQMNYFSINGHFKSYNGDMWYFGLGDIRFKSDKNDKMILHKSFFNHTFSNILVHHIPMNDEHAFIDKLISVISIKEK